MSQQERELSYQWRVSDNYWLKERNLTEDQYKQVILGCTAGNAGSCDCCMGNHQCEIRVLGYKEWLKRNLPKEYEKRFGKQLEEKKQK